MRLKQRVYWLAGLPKWDPPEGNTKGMLDTKITLEDLTIEYRVQKCGHSCRDPITMMEPELIATELSEVAACDVCL